MGALFWGILENAKGVDVCGVACNADEARAKLDDCRPDVLTLDVEMPGMSGMDFLAEIMEQRPMPVIMLSSIAQAGSGVAKRAMELGAVHCFPKPLHSSQEEFDATVRKLGDIVIRAHHGELGAEDAAGSDDAASAPPATSAFANYRSDGSLVVIACGDAGLADAMVLISAYPADCPPTILLIDADRGPVEAAIAAASGSAACSVVAASDGLALAPGTVAVAYDRAHHVIVEAGSPPRLRCAVRDPVGGIRPCADLLLGSIARARVPAKGGLLAGTGSAGAKGLQILHRALQIGLITPGKGVRHDGRDGPAQARGGGIGAAFVVDLLDLGDDLADGKISHAGPPVLRRAAAPGQG